MRHEVQIELSRTLFSLIDAGETTLAETVMENPACVYTDPRRLERERERLFGGYPSLVALSCRLPDSSTYLADDDGARALLLTRDSSGTVRAFFNACRHRGARVAEGCGRIERNLRCPYHGWTYDERGRLVGIPDQRSFPGVDLADHGLLPLAVVERDGLIWVGPDAEAFDLDEHLCGLADELAAYGFGRYHHYGSSTLRRAMNWKMVVDTFLEPYHFPVLHPETVNPIFLPNLCLFHPFGPHLRETLPRRSIEQMRALEPAEWNLVTHSALIYVLFPNVVFVMQGDHAEVWRIQPGAGVDESIIHLDFYIPEPAQGESARRHWDRNLELVLRTVETEDFPLGEGIQRGFARGGPSHVVYGRNEPALQHWQRVLAEATGGA